MEGRWRFIPIMLCVLFAISMINVIVYTYRKRKQWNYSQKTIAKEGYMKLYVQLEDGRGEIIVESVDEQLPLYSSEVIQKAIFLSPGEHTIRLSARAKDNSVSERVLPYYRDLGIFEVVILAKKDGIATLYLNVNTQNIYLKENEDL